MESFTDRRIKKMLDDLIRRGDKARFSSQLNVLEMNLRKSKDDAFLDDLLTIKKLKKIL